MHLYYAGERLSYFLQQFMNVLKNLLKVQLKKIIADVLSLHVPFLQIYKQVFIKASIVIVISALQWAHILTLGQTVQLLTSHQSSHSSC